MPVGVSQAPPAMNAWLYDSMALLFSALYRSTAICVRYRAEPQDLADPEVELVDPIADDCSPGESEVDVGELGVARERAAERQRDRRGRHVVVGGQLVAGQALERATDLHVDDGNRVRGEPLEVGEERRLLQAVRVQQGDLGQHLTQLARVIGPPSRARPSLEGQAASDARREVDLDAVPVPSLLRRRRPRTSGSCRSRPRAPQSRCTGWRSV